MVIYQFMETLSGGKSGSEIKKSGDVKFKIKDRKKEHNKIIINAHRENII